MERAYPLGASSPTEASQLLTSGDEYILQQIGSIIESNNQHAEQCLQELYDKDNLQFMNNFFSLATKCGALETRAGSQATQACLLYLRHFINKQKHRMPDLIR